MTLDLNKNHETQAKAKTKIENCWAFGNGIHILFELLQFWDLYFIRSIFCLLYNAATGGNKCN